MRMMIRVLLITGALIMYGLNGDFAEANPPQESWWIYMYTDPTADPVRVLEITSDVDGLGQCEFYRDLLDDSLMEAIEGAFFTCVTEIDLALWEHV